MSRNTSIKVFENCIYFENFGSMDLSAPRVLEAMTFTNFVTLYIWVLKPNTLTVIVQVNSNSELVTDSYKDSLGSM